MKQLMQVGGPGGRVGGGIVTIEDAIEQLMQAGRQWAVVVRLFGRSVWGAVRVWARVYGRLRGRG